VFFLDCRCFRRVRRGDKLLIELAVIHPVEGVSPSVYGHELVALHVASYRSP
jgi:hypothetical protein